MPRHRRVLILAAISALGALDWPWLLGASGLAYVVIFVWGGLFVGIYSVMGLAWGAGALAGPSLVGAALQASPTYGLPFSIAAACGLFAILLSVRRHSA